MITVSEEKCAPFSFLFQMLKKIGHIQQRKNHNQKLKSLQYLGYDKNILIVFS